MKFIKKLLVLFCFCNLMISYGEAESIDINLDCKTKKEINLLSEPSCNRLMLQNLGSEPIKNFFPYTKEKPLLSLEDLMSRLLNEENPFLALYHLWKKSLVINESISEEKCHPLDLLNFKGCCSKKTFVSHFFELCYSLGIEIRSANVRNQEFFDFGIHDEWAFFDVEGEQFYLNLDNQSLASSEDVMDDPFLVLRTKHPRYSNELNFKNSWTRVAAFEILDPVYTPNISPHPGYLSERSKGLDLFPNETFLFQKRTLQQEISPNQCFVEHTIDLEARKISHRFEYLSPFPIHTLTNHSDKTLRMVKQGIKLKPGESIHLKEMTFKINVAFKNSPKGKITLSGVCSEHLFPSLAKGRNKICLGTKNNSSHIRFKYEIDENDEKKTLPHVVVSNRTNLFDHCAPNFTIETKSEHVEKIWWQISSDSKFHLIPSNLDHVESFTSCVTLSPIDETFLHTGTTYYFRVKGYKDGKWGNWSDTYSFIVEKPLAVELVEFEQNAENEYELNWERYAEQSDEPIEYLIFGSNSLDFIPSIYGGKQINGIVDDRIVDEELNDNFLCSTTEHRITIPGNLAYYRLIAKRKGQLSIPSALVRVYDENLIQPRNVLQMVNEEDHCVAKRILIPSSYPGASTPFPPLLISHHPYKMESVFELHSILRSIKKLNPKKYSYELPEVSEEVWNEVRPYLLPENHPAWAKLNRVFCRSRVTQTPEHFKRAGFRRWRPGGVSRVNASSHPNFPEYFIKAYCDSELGIIYDWKKWIHRIKGAEAVRNCIQKYELQESFKVPKKWIYPMPKYPSTPRNPQFIRKEFALICENMSILEHKKNEKMYKKKMTHKLMKELYTVLQVCGLYDSVYIFNIPFCTDGRIAVIDTEYFYKWPVPFRKLNRAFSREMLRYWEKITYKGGKIPDGESQYHPPRMDRRDH